MIKNDGDQHNAGEKETELPRHAVAKKTCGELQKPCVGNKTHCHKNEPWNDHKRSSSNVVRLSRNVPATKDANKDVLWKGVERSFQRVPVLEESEWNRTEEATHRERAIRVSAGGT